MDKHRVITYGTNKNDFEMFPVNMSACVGPCRTLNGTVRKGTWVDCSVTFHAPLWHVLSFYMIDCMNLNLGVIKDKFL